MHPFATRSSPNKFGWTSFDLHVLSTPPAFILSQDQTLQQKRGRPLDRQRMSASAPSEPGKARVDDASLLIGRLACTNSQDGRYPCCCRQGVPTAELKAARRTARTGVLSSLPFSRSRSSGTHLHAAFAGLGVGAGWPFRSVKPLREARSNANSSALGAQPGQ
jgi:hypothetical protein